MKQLNLYSTILIAVALICASSISIAVITDGESASSICRQRHMLDRPPPPPDMRRGFGRGDKEMGPPHERMGRGKHGGGDFNSGSGRRGGNKLSRGARRGRDRFGPPTQSDSKPLQKQPDQPPVE